MPTTAKPVKRSAIITGLMVTIQPLGDRVVVRPLEKEQVTASGIVIPDTASGEKPQEGVVLAVGPGALKDDGSRAPMDVTVGQKVLFGKYAGDDVKIKDATGKDVEVKILHLDSILGIVI
jgi:chaperonin GroES